MKLLIFFKQYTSSQYHAIIKIEFFDFRKQKNQMLFINNAWNNIDNLLLF